MEGGGFIFNIFEYVNLAYRGFRFVYGTKAAAAAAATAASTCVCACGGECVCACVVSVCAGSEPYGQLV